MYRLFSSLSIEANTVIIVAVIILGIYSIIDLEKKKPGHPFKYVMYCLFPTLISILVNKYIYEFSLSSFWMRATDIVSIIFVVAFFVTFIFSTYLTYKRGYMSEKNKRMLVSTLIPCVIGIIICIVVILLTYI